MRKLKLHPGLGFEIPGVDANGLIVGSEGKLLLSYFFPFHYSALDDELVQPDHAILIAVHNTRMFEDQEVHMSTLCRFSRDEWPRPVYVSSTKAGSPDCFADTIQVLSGSWFAPLGLPWNSNQEPLGFTADHSAIPIPFLLDRLRRVLETGDVNAGRYYPVKNAKPDGGKLLQTYLRQKSKL